MTNERSNDLDVLRQEFVSWLRRSESAMDMHRDVPLLNLTFASS
jgi:hypothetical protein